DREFDGDVQVSNPRRLAEALAPLSRGYDIVLIDSPPSAPRLIVAALMAADAVLVPTLLDHLSLDGTGQFLRAYHGVVAGLRAELTGA
ncbi:ParA family protein, partial [Mycobacterium tuberculosis]|nr:ParA family protein [Mycobacterium tuberculosis]